MTWCVWSLLPNRSGPDGWSRVTGGLTEAEAEWYAKVSFFKSRAMPDEEES